MRMTRSTHRVITALEIPTGPVRGGLVLHLPYQEFGVVSVALDAVLVCIRAVCAVCTVSAGRTISTISTISAISARRPFASRE
jgi:hypothetical protein